MRLLLIAPILFAPDIAQERDPDPLAAHDRFVNFGESTESIDIRYTSIRYDHVFKTVTRTKGRLYWESSAHWMVYEEPIQTGRKTERVGGQNYNVRTVEPNGWLRDGKQLSAIDYPNGACQGWADEVPDETGIASTIRVLAAIPRRADLNCYSLTSRLDGGKPRVNLAPTRRIPSTTLFGQPYMRQVPEISMLLNERTLRPTAVRMKKEGNVTVFVIQSEVRNVVPEDRDEILFPCPWLFGQPMVDAREELPSRGGVSTCMFPADSQAKP